MKCASLAIVLLCFFLFFSAPGWAQVSFFQPPTFTNCSPSDFANLFVADFNGDGKPDLLCSDGTLSLGNGDGTFKLGTPVSLNNSQGIAAVADFNGDGRPDVLETGAGSTLLVLLGNGDGTFQPPITSAGVIGVLAAADVNGDGKADVVAAYNGSVNVCISNGDGTFKAPVPYSLGSSNGSNVLAGDFNGDGKLDVAVYAVGSLGSEVVVLLGNGDGTFQAPKTSPAPSYYSGYTSFYMVAGDFNGDGKLDLSIGAGCASLACGGGGPLYILLGNGDGTFQAPQATVSNAGPFGVVDVNGDGRLDVVYAGTPGVAQIYLGNGDGTFSQGRSYVAAFPDTPYIATTIATADFNSDGNPDIATAGGVLLGNGDGTFQGIPYSSGFGGRIVIGDFEKSGKPDFAVLSAGSPSSTVSVEHNNGDGTFSQLHTYSVPQGTVVAGDMDIVEGDVNGDGNLDLVVIGEDASSSDFEYSVLLGNGDGSFQAPVTYTPGIPGVLGGVAAIADLRNDHKLDVLMLGVNLAVLLGNGDGTFAAPAVYYPGGMNPGGSAYLLLGDFNGDGKLDVANDTGGADMLYGSGNGTLQPAVVPSQLATAGFSPFFAADLRNIGRVDLIGSDNADILGEVALNNGDGTFTFLPLSYGPVAVADVNGDGRPDLFTVLSSNQTCPIGVQLGNGDGTFGSPINLGCLPYPLSKLIADVNGDGRPDIVFPWGGGVAVLLNTTRPSLELSATALTPTPVAAGSSATSTVTAAPIFGFNGTEILSCTGLPSGASCTFSPPSISGSSKTSALTITTSAGVAAGTYPVQIQGTAGSIVNSVAASLVVQAAPDFSIGAASGSSTKQTVSAGQTASFSLAFAPTGGFTGTLNLSCAVTPAATPAATCSVPSSVQISGSGTQTVTVKVETTAPVTTGAIPHVNFPSGPTMLFWTLMFLGSTGLWMRNRKHLPVLAAPIVVLVAFSVGCGGSSSSSTHTTPGTPAGTYTTTVTATSGGTSHNMALQVVVQ
jgi:hypothetical protein